VAVQYAVTASAALVAATAKTAVEATATANMPPEWVALDVSNDLASGSVLVELGTVTATGTGTAYTAKRFGQAVGTAATTFKINDTVEPTGFAAILAWRVPFGSTFSYQWPLGRELLQPVSTLYAVRLTGTVAGNYVVNLVVEE
jgi:hypothetical protein